MDPSVTTNNMTQMLATRDHAVATLPKVAFNIMKYVRMEHLAANEMERLVDRLGEVSERGARQAGQGGVAPHVQLERLLLCTLLQVYNMYTYNLRFDIQDLGIEYLRLMAVAEHEAYWDGPEELALAADMEDDERRANESRLAAHWSMYDMTIENLSTVEDIMEHIMFKHVRAD